MKYSLLIIVVFVFLIGCSEKQKMKELSFLHTQGQDIVNEQGEKILLRGVGLGNWFLPEGYMWQFGKNGDRPRKIEKLVSELIGDKDAAQFWSDFHKNYITEADIIKIKELGFNSVRPALNARLFLTETDNPQLVAEGFQMLDSLITWCGRHNLYVIIDMHGAPGGQTGQNIDDSPHNLPELFIDTKYEDRLMKLWMEIVNKYKDKPAVAAYDLLNEPLPNYTGAAGKYKHLLEPMYKKLTESIRKVDNKHIIIVEGSDWSNDWSVFSKPFDKNMIYQFHYYCWNPVDNLNDISVFTKKQKEFNAPVWVGETGEKNATIYYGTTQLFEHHNIGWAFWPWKRMGGKNGIQWIKSPEEWELITKYSDGGEKPDQAKCKKIFDQYLANILLANCEENAGTLNALFRTVPLKLQAENYGHQGFNTSYWVKDTAQKSKYYRTNEPVQILLANFDSLSRTSDQYLRLQTNEWASYILNSADNKQFTANLKIKTTAELAKLNFILNGKSSEIILKKGDWQELKVEKLNFTNGFNTIQIKVSEGVVDIDWVEIK